MLIFLSSTCYDLRDLRPEIEHYFKSKADEVLLSDRATFPVNPDQHRHDVCIENVKKCDLFLLVIDGRFGSEYHKNKNISITQAEFREAISENKRIIAFIRKEVWDERNLYKKNAETEIKLMFVKDKRLFQFIDEIQNHEKGIWIEMFTSSVEVKERLDNLYPRIVARSAETTNINERINITNSKNANTGNISTNGGNFKIGDS